MKKTLLIGKLAAMHGNDQQDIEVHLELKNGKKGPRLSFTGDVWRCDHRDITQGGQMQDSLYELAQQCTELRVPLKRVARIVELWNRWHMNDARAGCEHQRATWGDVSRKVEVVSYGLTTVAYQLRKKAHASLLSAAIKGPEAVAELQLSPTERALAELNDWYKDRHSPPDADSPLSGCYEVKKREMKAIGWTFQTEHPDGILCKSCEVCGYKYGNAWLYEAIPEEVLAELREIFGELGA